MHLGIILLIIATISSALLQNQPVRDKSSVNRDKRQAIGGREQNAAQQRTSRSLGKILESISGNLMGMCLAKLKSFFFYKKVEKLVYQF